ncbi:MAG: 6-phosphogluconate dehydrogenase, NAD-binding protein [Chloroflexota bacterium]|jgi:3-hydroxyisobutyrate dehydrogenase/2-hydroxy-3-oxopropionate reductase|nr:6-phosphogluconate dehydrogenase, NAD-binding protein [Chloroflexota bacterium]
MTAVGLLGTGRMGSAMGRALAGAGFEVVTWNRTPGPASELADVVGGRSVARPRDVAAAADVCISMLADGAAVVAVYTGPDGVLEGARPGNVLCDASTVPPSTLRQFEVTARAAGAGLLDTPVSGSVGLAESGKLTIMVGGSDDDLAVARPVLEVLAGTVFHMGPLGSGAAMKLAVNTLIFGLNQALAEGLTLATAAGIPVAAAYDVLTASAAGAPFVAYKRAAFLEPATAPVAFSLDLAAKDLRLITALAASVGVEMPGAATDLEVIEATAAAIGGDHDMAAVISQLRRSTGTEEGRA